MKLFINLNMRQLIFCHQETDVPKVAKASFNLAAHVLSGLIGASLAVLFGRRTPIQA